MNDPVVPQYEASVDVCLPGRSNKKYRSHMLYLSRDVWPTLVPSRLKQADVLGHLMGAQVLYMYVLVSQVPARHASTAVTIGKVSANVGTFAVP